MQQSVKANDKIGKFGIGFNSVYHITGMTYCASRTPPIRVSVDTLYRDGANDVSRERIQTAPLADPGRAS